MAAADDKSMPLGRNSAYPKHYAPQLLYPVARQLKRDELGIDAAALPFGGEDVWNGYELSWLDENGKPVVALGRFRFPCSAPNLVESKSFKLYLNSFNHSRFATPTQVAQIMRTDLAAVSGAPVSVELFDVDDVAAWQIDRLPGECLDQVELTVDTYQLCPQLLAGAVDDSVKVSEALYSHLLKSNCLVTGQPDWASVWIRYRGGRIERQRLLAYLISFRQHNEFHEQCVERIFTDLMHYCRPEALTVYARYTRRGGLDINPWRSNETERAFDCRLLRQ